MRLTLPNRHDRYLKPEQAVPLPESGRWQVQGRSGCQVRREESQGRKDYASQLQDSGL